MKYRPLLMLSALSCTLAGCLERTETPPVQTPAASTEESKSIESAISKVEGVLLKKSSTGEVVDLDLRKASDEWLQYAPELANLKSLKALKMQSAQVDDATIALLKNHPTLVALDIARCNISDASLEIIATIKQLEVLNLAECNSVTDEGVKQLVALTAMRNLTLAGQGITNDSLLIVGQLKRLSVLNLYHCAVDDDGFGALNELDALQQFSCYGTPISGAGLLQLGNAQGIVKLNLRATKITDEHLSDALPRFKELKSLELSETLISDAAVPAIVELPNLVDVNFWLTKISDAGVAQFENKPLKRLNLDNIPELTNAAAMSASKIKTLEFLHLGKTGIDDACLEYFQDLESLSELHVSHTAVTQEAVDAFRKLRPAMKVVF